eukprot:365684-Chlamydomonas_euryale.AAC.12
MSTGTILTAGRRGRCQQQQKQRQQLHQQRRRQELRRRQRPHRRRTALRPFGLRRGASVGSRCHSRRCAVARPSLRQARRHRQQAANTAASAAAPGAACRPGAAQDERARGWRGRAIAWNCRGARRRGGRSNGGTLRNAGCRPLVGANRLANGSMATSAQDNETWRSEPQRCAPIRPRAGAWRLTPRQCGLSGALRQASVLIATTATATAVWAVLYEQRHALDRGPTRRQVRPLSGGVLCPPKTRRSPSRPFPSLSRHPCECIHLGVLKRRGSCARLRRVGVCRVAAWGFIRKTFQSRLVVGSYDTQSGPIQIHLQESAEQIQDTSTCSTGCEMEGALCRCVLVSVCEALQSMLSQRMLLHGMISQCHHMDGMVPSVPREVASAQRPLLATPSNDWNDIY